MRRPSDVGLCCLALALLAVGAAWVNAPLRMAGPFNFGLSFPLGVLGLAAGMALLEAVPASVVKPVCLLGALVVVAIAGRNFWRHPPIDDGAWFLLRYGREAADDPSRLVPAEPFAHMIPFTVAGLAVARAFGLRKRLPALAVFIGCAAASCAVFAFFMRGLLNGATTHHLATMLAGLGLLAAGCAGWANRFDAARIGLAVAAATIVLSLASWALYALPLR
jgi:hypothetical protein